MSEGKKVLVANVKMLGAAQNMVECDVDAEGANVAKILSVQSVPRIVSTENLESEVSYEGVVFVKVFVLCSDGAVKAISSQHKFGGKLENKTLNISSKLLAQAKSVDCVVTGVSEKGARVVCSIETSFMLCANTEIPIMIGSDSKLQVQEKQVQHWAVNDCQNTEFEAVGEILFAGEDVRVVLIENSVIVKSCTLFEGYGVVKGEIFSKVLYTNGQKALLQSASTITLFTQEVEIANATNGGMLHANVSLSEEKFKLLLSQEKKQAKATLEFVLNLALCEYELTTTNLIADAYSTTNEVKCGTTEFEQTTPVGELFFEKKVEGNVVLDDNQPKVSKLVAFSGATIGAVETTRQEGKIKVVGVAYANIIFETEQIEKETEVTEEETTSKKEVFAPHAVQIEIPFEIYEDYLEPVNITSSSIMIDDVDVSVKKGKNVFFDAKIKAHLFLTKTESYSCITSVAVLQERKEKEEGIEIVFAKKGNSVWDIAKKLGVGTSQIVMQNPTISDPLEKDERIVLYYQCLEQQ